MYRNYFFFACINIFICYIQEGATCNPTKFISSCHDTQSLGGVLPCKLASCHFTGIDNPNNVVYMHRKYIFFTKQFVFLNKLCCYYILNLV